MKIPMQIPTQKKPYHSSHIPNLEQNRQTSAEEHIDNQPDWKLSSATTYAVFSQVLS